MFSSIDFRQYIALCILPSLLFIGSKNVSVFHWGREVLTLYTSTMSFTWTFQIFFVRQIIRCFSRSSFKYSLDYFFQKCSMKDAHRKQTPSNKTQALPKMTFKDIWVVGTLNLIFITGIYNEIKFSKK